MTNVATAVVELLAEAGVRYVFGVITLKQEHQGFPCFGTPLFPAAYTSAGNYFGVPAITATSVDEVHAAIAQGLQTAGPVIVEAMMDPSEYEDLIRFNPRPTSQRGDPHAS